MATLYIAEFCAAGGHSNFPVSAVQVVPVAEQTVPIGGASTQCTNPFSKNTNLIRINCDATCSLAWGTNPTATTATMRLAQNQTEYFAVPPGQNFKVAVISNT